MSTLRKKLLFSTTALFGVFLLLAGAIEVFARPFGYGSYIVFEPNERLLFIPKADQVGVTVADRRPITINSQSLRYPETLSDEPESLRVMTFGDSVTMGWAMSDTEHYTALLESRLRERLGDPKIQAVSAGVNAYALTTAVERFAQMAEEGPRFDIAVVAYCFNISHEDLAALRGEDRQRFLKKVRLKNLVRRSALYNLVIEDWLREAVYYRIRDRIVAGSWQVEGETDDGGEEGARGWDGQLSRIERALERAGEIAEEHDIQLVLLLLGSQGQDEEVSEYQQAFKTYAESHSVPLVDMAAFNVGGDPDALFVDWVHPSRLGHERIADQLAIKIAELAQRPDKVEASLSIPVEGD